MLLLLQHQHQPWVRFSPRLSRLAILSGRRILIGLVNDRCHFNPGVMMRWIGLEKDLLYLFKYSMTLCEGACIQY